jgi:hypothetical protein
MYDPACVSLIYDVSYKEVKKHLITILKNMEICFLVEKYMILFTHM